MYTLNFLKLFTAASVPIHHIFFTGHHVRRYPIIIHHISSETILLLCQYPIDLVQNAGLCTVHFCFIIILQTWQVPAILLKLFEVAINLCHFSITPESTMVAPGIVLV